MIEILSFSPLYSLGGDKKKGNFKKYLNCETVEHLGEAVSPASSSHFSLQPRIFVILLLTQAWNLRGILAQQITMGLPENWGFHLRYTGLEEGWALPPPPLSLDTNGFQIYSPQLSVGELARQPEYNSGWKIWAHEQKSHICCCCDAVQGIIDPGSPVQFCLQYWWWNTLLCQKSVGIVPQLSSPLFPKVTSFSFPSPEKCRWSLRIGWDCSCRYTPQLFDCEKLVLLLSSRGALKKKCFGNKFEDFKSFILKILIQE